MKYNKKKICFRILIFYFFEINVYNDNFIVKDCEIFLDDVKGKFSFLNRNILCGY